jgi:hypothetical protein
VANSAPLIPKVVLDKKERRDVFLPTDEENSFIDFDFDFDFDLSTTKYTKNENRFSIEDQHTYTY